jgi:peptidoglycan/LPS O-acetylase OafA/YrhL
LQSDKMQTRTDIQALRGFAVLLVVLQHSRIFGLSAGYLGVDIFFVISGFLITGMVKRGVERGEFRFSKFYFRRAKRLLPAAYVTFLLTAVLAPLFLESSEYRDFLAQMIGAVTFSANVVLWKQTGYFNVASELKPLLHVWSLSVEEQYYLLLPAALVLIAPRRWLAVALGVFGASFVLCLIGDVVKPAASFYLLPTRCWELVVGSVGALIGAHNWPQRIAAAGFYPALLLILLVPFMPIGGVHPGSDAIVVCLSTVAIILRGHSLLNFTLPARLLARVGDFSYSLYLVHWPIFAFANNASVSQAPGGLPIGLRVAALTLSFLLGWLLFRLVEMPVRKAELRPSLALVTQTLVASFVLVAMTLVMQRNTAGAREYADLRQVNYGFDKRCEFGARYEPIPQCEDSSRPSIFVWGDSYAMHLVPGIAATSMNYGVAQATRSGCGPILGIAPLERQIGGQGQTVGFDQAWAKDCMKFNESVVSYLAAAPWVSVVVLSSPFGQYLNSSRWRILVQDGDRLETVNASADLAMRGLLRTVFAVRSMGKRVVLVAPPPMGSFNVASCLERKATGKVLLGAPRDCILSVTDYHKTMAPALQFLARVPDQLDVGVFSLDDFLCDAQACKTSMDGVLLYRDAGHLSVAGSRLIAKRVSLAEKLVALAR